MRVPKNPYMVLGVTPTAEKDDIKKAYRDLAKKHHPDLNPDSKLTAAAKTREITEAYNLLDNAQRKKELDDSWRKLRVPKDIGTRAKEPEVKKGFFARLFGGKGGPAPKGNFNAFFTAGITCFQYPGGKLTAQAEVEFRQAAEANPQSAEARYNLALACYWQGKYTEALGLLKEWVRANPQDAFGRSLVESLTETE
jgi:curved DNA-binding protein CbpA